MSDEDRGRSSPAASQPDNRRLVGRRGGPGSILLIDRRTLVRECLHEWLAGCRDFVVESVAEPAMVLRPARLKSLDVVIFSLGAAKSSAAEVRSEVEHLRQGLTDVPLVLMADDDEIVEITEALRRGVRGYIPTSLSLVEASEALRFVMAGGTFVPASALVRSTEARQRQSAPDHHGAQAGDGFERLTPREMEVLARLRQGKPNKVIAHELAISESTVKVFVRKILTKLRAVNRTEVAYLTQEQFRSRRPSGEIVRSTG